MSIFYLEVVKYQFVIILCSKAGVPKITWYVSPLLKPSIVEITHLLCYDEWYNAVSETFFEHDKSSHTTVAILKWMNNFEAMMEVKNLVQCMLLAAVVFFQEQFYLLMNILWCSGFYTSYFIGQLLVIPHHKP